MTELMLIFKITLRIIKENHEIFRYYSNLMAKGFNNVSAINYIASMVINEWRSQDMMGMLVETPFSKRFVGKKIEVQLFGVKGLYSDKTTTLLCSGVRHDNGWFLGGKNFGVISPMRIVSVGGECFNYNNYIDEFEKQKRSLMPSDCEFLEKNFNLKYLSERYPSFFVNPNIR